jgi:hypothetical protein
MLSVSNCRATRQRPALLGIRLGDLQVGLGLIRLKNGTDVLADVEVR